MRDGNARLGFRRRENGMGVSGGQRGKWPDARRQLDFSRPVRARARERGRELPASGVEDLVARCARNSIRRVTDGTAPNWTLLTWGFTFARAKVIDANICGGIFPAPGEIIVFYFRLS